jgi:hypothetical protein
MTTINDRMRRKGRRRFIETYEFPPALHSKLVEELRSPHAADVALDGLRGWYLACLYADGTLIGMPSHAVDEAWHEMILMTRHYSAFCDRAFGRYLHHNPDSTLSVSMDEILIETLAIVDAHDLPMTLFTADDDAGLDFGYIWTASDLRRMRDSIERRDRDRRARRRAGTATGGGSGYAAGEGGSWSFFGFGGGDGGGGSDGGGGGGCGGGGGGGCGGGGG